MTYGVAGSELDKLELEHKGADGLILGRFRVERGQLMWAQKTQMQNLPARPLPATAGQDEPVEVRRAERSWL